MTALARSIGTQDTVLYLSASLDVGSLPAPFLLDAECVLVTGGDMQSQVFVSRGQFGTAPEAHDIGAALVSGWGSTNGPVTLSQVLATGNETDGTPLVSDSSGLASLALNADGSSSLFGGATSIGISAADGDILLATSGGLYTFSSTGDFTDGAGLFTVELDEFKVQVNADFFIADNQTDAAQGKVLTAAEGPSGDYGAHAEWLAICAVQTGDPSAQAFTTPLIFDNTAVTGGLYFWNGAGYTKIGGAL